MCYLRSACVDVCVAHLAVAQGSTQRTAERLVATVAGHTYLPKHVFGQNAFLLPLYVLLLCRYVELLWNGLLVLAPTYLAVMLLGTPIFKSHALPAMTGVMMSGLLFYCVLFAVNSSIHSFLIVKCVGDC